MKLLYFILTVTLIVNYCFYVVALYKTYDMIFTEGQNTFYSDLYFKTKKELLIHAIPFYFYYLFILFIVRGFNKLK